MELQVGGNPCRPVWQSQSSILCRDLDATAWTGSRRTAVRVVVNDLETTQDGLFTIFDSPSVSTVTPNEASSLGDVPTEAEYVPIEARPSVPVYENVTVCLV